MDWQYFFFLLLRKYFVSFGLTVLMRKPLLLCLFPVSKVLFVSGCFQDFFSLPFHFENFNFDVYWHEFLWVYSVCHLLSFWITSLAIFRKFSGILSLSMFFTSTFFLSSFGTLMKYMLTLLLSHRSLKGLFFFFNSTLSL